MDIISYEEVDNAPIIFSDEGVQWYGDADDRPEIEQQLQKLQADFYSTQDKVLKQNIWSEMFVLVQKYSRSLILKKNKGRRWTDADEIDDKATQTALAFMSQYIYRPGFHCGASFAGMINPKVLETLYKYNKDDSNLPLSMILGDTNLELEDMQERANFKSIYDNEINKPGDFIDKVNLKDVVYELCSEIDEVVIEEKQKFKMRAYLQILLRKPKNKHAKPVFLKNCTKKELDLINLLELELYNRLSKYNN